MYYFSILPYTFVIQLGIPCQYATSHLQQSLSNCCSNVDDQYYYRDVMIVCNLGSLFHRSISYITLCINWYYQVTLSNKLSEHCFYLVSVSFLPLLLFSLYSPCVRHQPKIIPHLFSHYVIFRYLPHSSLIIAIIYFLILRGLHILLINVMSEFVFVIFVQF